MYPVISASVILLVISMSASARHPPYQPRYDDDYYYDAEEAFEETEVASPTFRHSFQPSTTRCCKAGEKVAKKGMTCESSEHLNIFSDTWEEHASKLMGDKKDRHDVPDHVIDLLKKAQVCLISEDYFGNFKKCCQYRQNYQTALTACKRYKHGSKRRACRKQVHWQYP